MGPLTGCWNGADGSLYRGELNNGPTVCNTDGHEASLKKKPDRRLLA